MTLRRTETAPPASPRRSAPLFDPHGLSVSLNDGDDVSTEVRNDKASSSNDSDYKNGLRRGRRRRSSEYVDCQTDQRETRQGEDESLEGGTAARVSSGEPNDDRQGPRLWWQQPTAERSGGQVRKGPRVSTTSLEQAVRSRQTSTESSSQSPLVRSPAAAFLSSMNDMLSSPSSSTVAGGSGTWPSSYRTYSLSPPRQDLGLPRSIVQQEASVIASPSVGSVQGSERSVPESQGLSGAARQLMDSRSGESKRHSHTSPPLLSKTALRPDDEGARFGPNGRYIIGRMIGYGAFSTIREAWDLGDGSAGQTREAGLIASQNWHRVAVKIVYAQGEDAEKGVEEAYNELEMWSNLPAHPNILPLLYHERIKSEEQGTMNVKANETIDLLVMPFCQASLLKHVRTGGSLIEPQTASSSRSGSIAATGLHRTASMRGENSNTSALEGGMPTLERSRMHVGRTGSGFIPHDHRSSTISVGERVVSSPLSSLVGRSASFAAPTGPAPGSILRTSSIRQRNTKEAQSKGLPMHIAREIIWQLTEALLCLHHKAAVLHGDLKLENVLGQQWQPSTRRSSLPLSKDDGKENEGLSPVLESDGKLDVDEEAKICWRLADFGLSRKVPSKDADSTGREAALRLSNKPSRHPTAQAAFASTQVRSTSTSAANSMQNRLNGGSLAYTAPEAFVVPDVDDADATSPYAPDMWALGCIVYALFAGYLPFMDAFEPRLQNKIALGQWDMPERLKVRRKGMRAEGSNAESMQRGTSHAAERNRAAPGFASNTVSPSSSVRRLSGVPDMSASLPALPARRDSSFRARFPFSPSTQTILQHDDDDTHNTSGVFIADEMEEDECNDVQQEESGDVGDTMDGTSKDRAAVRLILRGLLEPDASKRLTIRQLAAMEWVSGWQSAQTEGPLEGEMLFDPHAPIDAIDDDVVKDADLPSSLREELNANIVSDLDRVKLADAQMRNDSSDQEEEGLRRGRARRRDRDHDQPPRSRSSVKPIDIDRSKSRSRSRARDDESPIWALDTPQGGGFNWRQQQRDHQPSYVAGDEYISHWTRPPATSSRPSSKGARSSSVDNHSKRGRSTSKAAPDNASLRNPSRSASRSRRVDLDLVMPQLSRPRSTASSVDQLAAGVSESRDSSPALPTASDDHTASRSSFWKSPLRARDRLANLVGGGLAGSLGSGGSSRLQEQKLTQDADGQAEESEQSKTSTKEWWQR